MVKILCSCKSYILFTAITLTIFGSYACTDNFLPVECETDKDCVGGYYCENNGICYSVVACEDDEGCADDEVCGPSKECRKKEYICENNQDCEDGKYCEDDGICYPIMSCEDDEGCADDEYCDPMGKCRKKDPNGNDIPICDAMNIEATSIPPNLLLAVDRSGSMKRKTSDSSDRTKIQDAKDAINILLDEGDGKIRFGWMQFPGASTCTPGVVSVDCADESISIIRAQVDKLEADGGTPTGESLQNANAYEDLHDPSRESFIILLTDGKPTCPNGGGTAEENELDNQLAINAVTALQSAGIDTFVIGLGEDINSSNPAVLNSMAVEGGRPRDGDVKYYQVNSLEDLNDVLEEIGGIVIGCSQALDVVPEESGYLWVNFDGQPIPRDPDHLEGFDYDPVNNQINFYGEACDKLKNGQVIYLEIKMGCAAPA